MHHLPIQPILR
ncbi:hypothetical protein LINGRAHAP2_LOCUS24580 [Linum grandiflorum]